jgi:solute carrier family 25 (mitochondrial oxoglutarate transporter), member 11
MNKGVDIPFYMKMLSGMGSGAIAVTIGTPFDVALVRMQSDSMKDPRERRSVLEFVKQDIFSYRVTPVKP